MRRWLPAPPPVRWPVIIPQPSSDGHTVYNTSVWPARISCPCRGFANRQRCRHEKDDREMLRNPLA